MDNQRFLLIIALAIIVFLIFQAWQDEQRQRARPPEPVAAPEPREAPEAPAAETPVPAPPSAAPTEVAEAQPSQGQRIRVVTDVVEAIIDTAGGGLREVKLRKHPVSVDEPDNPFLLMSDSDGEFYVAQSGLIPRAGDKHALPDNRTRYTAESTRYVLAPDQDRVKVPLHWQAPDGVRYTKVYTFHRDRYVIDVEFRFQNTTAELWRGHQYRELQRAYVESEGGFFLGRLPTFTGAAIYTPKEQYEKIAFSDIQKLTDIQKKNLDVNYKDKERKVLEGVTGGWVAMLQHYFVGAWIPAADEKNVFYTDVVKGNQYIIGLTDLAATSVAPGEAGRLASTLYAGPKEHRRLKPLAEGMELTVDYGWLTFISAPLFWLLEYIHRWVRNWGWAIIVLTVIIKLVFYPLSAASYKSMAHMKRMQPKLQSLRERFGHDKQRMNQAMMELYKKEKINPLGGCLPIAIQIPVFIALYWVLLESVEMRQAPFILWIRDLSLPDPFYVLPILMGITMFLQQKLSPAALDPMQKRIMSALPVVFTVFFLLFPAGLVLYWLINNVLSIAQQWQITRMIEARAK